MSDANDRGFDAGFSDEEKEDLERMIGAFNDDRKSHAVDSANENPAQQAAIIERRFAQLGEIVSRTSRRLDSFFEIIELMYRKSEIMNDRLDTLISELQKDSDTIME